MNKNIILLLLACSILWLSCSNSNITLGKGYYRFSGIDSAILNSDYLITFENEKEKPIYVLSPKSIDSSICGFSKYRLLSNTDSGIVFKLELLQLTTPVLRELNKKKYSMPDVSIYLNGELFWNKDTLRLPVFYSNGLCGRYIYLQR